MGRHSRAQLAGIQSSYRDYSPVVSLDARQQHSGMTCIEIDGDSHAEQIEYDQVRTAYLNELGYTVIRFTNREVFNQCEAVLQQIAVECKRLAGTKGETAV